MFIDVGKTDRETATNWVAESGVLDLFLLLGPSPHQVTPSVLALATVNTATVHPEHQAAITGSSDPVVTQIEWHQGQHIGWHITSQRRCE